MSTRLTRRELIAGITALVSTRISGHGQRSGARRIVESVTGAHALDALGVTLMHEHVLVDFIGADRVTPSRYDAEDAFKVILPFLTGVKSHGCETLLECTPAYLGRNVRLLKRLSEASGVKILTNTGYYGAAKDKYLPQHAFTEDVEQIAGRWTREIESGIDGTTIKPAFMKIGVDEAPLTDVDAKLVRAAALTSRRTGLPIASHTSTGAAAIAELELLDRADVAPAAFIWVHAQNERDATFHARVASAGAWVEFDGISESSIDPHVKLVRQMKADRLLGRVLISQDAGWYHVGEAGGGRFRPYDALFTRFVPALEEAGVTKAEIRQLLVDNPRRALAREA